MDEVAIYHNPRCGTSRNTLGLIRNAGIEPRIVEYLQAPPDRTTLLDLVERMQGLEFEGEGNAGRSSQPTLFPGDLSPMG